MNVFGMWLIGLCLFNVFPIILKILNECFLWSFAKLIPSNAIGVHFQRSQIET
jgi:hypothetical protein